MAKIKLRNGEILSAEDEWAKKLLTIKNDPNVKANDAVEIIPGRFEVKSSIAGVEFASAEPGDYNLDNTQQRQIVKDFEKELQEFGGPYAFELWMLENGLITRATMKTFDNKGKSWKKPENYSINAGRLKEYEEAVKKNKALDALKRRRAFAAKQAPINDVDDDTEINVKDIPF